MGQFNERASAMAFQVPASKASIGQDVFEFEIDGKTFSVKKLKFLSIGKRDEIGDSVSATLDFFGAKGTEQGEAVRGLDEEQFEALTDAWQSDSDVTLGESTASAS